MFGETTYFPTHPMFFPCFTHPNMLVLGALFQNWSGFGIRHPKQACLDVWSMGGTWDV